MSSVIYAFKRIQCLHLCFKDFNVFRHLHFQRLQCLYLHFKDFNVFYLLHFITLYKTLTDVLILASRTVLFDTSYRTKQMIVQYFDQEYKRIPKKGAKGYFS